MVDITERLRLNATDWIFGDTATTAMKEILSLRQRVAELEKERDELLTELEHCAGVFRRYEQIHLLKCTDDGNDKAHGNGVLAARCEAAIASVKEK